MIDFQTHNVRRNARLPLLRVTGPLWLRSSKMPGHVEMGWGSSRINARGLVVYDEVLLTVHPYDSLVGANTDIAVAAREMLRRQLIE
jgi:hypothetical protein